jgi:hypothetical protein
MDEAKFCCDSKLDVKIMPSVEETKQQQQRGIALVATPLKTPETKRRSAFSFVTPIVCSGRRRREERAAYEATRTFIGAGFDEFEYADVKTPTLEVPIRPVSVLVITGTLLVRLSLGETKQGWQTSAVMARLILGDTAIDESGMGAVSWIQRMSLSSLGVEV